MGVADTGGDPDGLVEQGDGLAALAAQQLHEPHVGERIEDSIGRQPDPDVVGPAQVGEGQVELAEGEVGLAAVVVGEGRERVRTGQLGGRDGQAQLGDGLGVLALLGEPASPIGADAHDLGHVAGALGVVEGDLVEPSIGGQVAVQGGEHRPCRVDGGQRPVVSALLRPFAAPAR